MATLFFFLLSLYHDQQEFKVRITTQEVQLIQLVEKDTLRFYSDGSSNTSLSWRIEQGRVILDAAGKTAN